MVTKIGIYRDLRNKGKPWIVRWFTMTDPESGKRRRFCKSFELKRDAERFQQRGRPRANPEKQTLDTFLKSWLKRRKADLKPSSLELYESTVQRLLDYFGKGHSLSDLDLEQAEDFVLAQKNCATGREGTQLSDWTREQIKRHCKTIFGAAVQWGYIPVNPFEGLRSKRLTIKRWYRMKPKEYHALLEVTPSLREKVAYALLIERDVTTAELI